MGSPEIGVMTWFGKRARMVSTEFTIVDAGVSVLEEKVISVCTISTGWCDHWEDLGSLESFLD